jgi:nicotinate-nucleotide adenylyltransferase
MHIGIYGGTFNPPHIGHLITAEAVKQATRLDSIMFIPSYISPHKNEGEEHLALHRFEMMKLAVQNNPSFEVLDFEISKNEISYTITTLEYLAALHPDNTFSVIVGMDNYMTFHLWKEPKRILQMASLIVMNRPQYPRKVNEVVGTVNTLFVDVPNIDLSSSEIRQKVKEGKSIKYLVPDSVENYIRQHHLYK